ncbi:acid phosphatase [Rhodanobacter panaciterrae]|uniref:Acid phosphatase n=1 Tax=Rhodanobacter panaciterrae TaxID=490572 RepID=A0ABQ2ZQR7_9GAMM|nr:phosphatase PAP2 family protein [Rhodanobacter panaciterrae]GGY20020.1 acid phosphatase [Rhodanobacter panaciterrae]
MMARRFLLLVALLLPVVPALAADGSTRTDAIDLTLLLAPPPAAGSPAALDDLQAVLVVQSARTTADDKAAKADAERSAFRFADVLGPGLTADALPRTAAFFKRVNKLDKVTVDAAKSFWHHPRPAEVSDQVHPLSVEKPGDWSYPSGHATFGYTTAVLLANMLPEKRTAIFDRAALYARHRVVMGVHFPSDVEAGRIAGTVIAAQLLRDPAWQADFLAARDELRKALALTPATGG